MALAACCPAGFSGTISLVSRSSPSQPSFCWRVTIKIFSPGLGSPYRATYISLISLIPFCGAGSRPRYATFRRLLRPALHGACPNTMMSSVTGPETFTSSRTPSFPLVAVSRPTGLGLKITWAVGSSSSPPRRMHALALFRLWKSCWPVSGPEPNLVLLRTLGPTSFHTSRWAWVSTRLKARAKSPNSPRMYSRAGVRLLRGTTWARLQFPNGD
jgi:hypothetical protein